uniref:Cytochrome P450 n=1 Tax=Biomphalaria glabrata TaxID=6526 RepID=A0A2C9JMR0_BIOGL
MSRKKIFDEINEHVGTEREPNIRDKQNLTYLKAAIMETQRLASIVPNSVPRTCHSDMQVRGYTIPKDSFILPCLDSVLHDSQIWGYDVMAFNPERFISQDGQLQMPEEFIPFSVGNRTCLGENMAKTSLFLYISNMIQKFEFQPAVLGQPPPLKYISGFILSPERYQVKIIARSI